ncbi:HHLA1 protein, partial [Erpornis zantholeuca]|nr:HHLA1 protein [Erpornis zantholeuca]
IMQGFCWHVAVKMSLGFLCLFLVFSTGKDNVLVLPTQQGKLFLSLFLHFSASCIKKENKKEKQVAVLATAELPAKSLDLSAINLTELVNGMLSTALRGTKKLFSLLSVTSYSSFAFHKVSVTIYNISNAKNIDPGNFPMHYCYCLNNVTNDLTDFTALLVDIIGNSTSYLTEIFKSTSILSVRQSNDSDCIYICVMAGKTGKNLSDFLEILEKSPGINYTFSSNTSSDLGKYILENKRKQQQHFVKLQEDLNKTLDSSAEHVWTFKCEHMLSDLTLIPLAQKGGEIPTTKSSLWPKTVGAKGLWFPSPHVDDLRPQGTAGSPRGPEGSSAPLPAPQPSPSEYSQECWNLPYPAAVGLGQVSLSLGRPSRSKPSLQKRGHRALAGWESRMACSGIFALHNNTATKEMRRGLRMGNLEGLYSHGGMQVPRSKGKERQRVLWGSEEGQRCPQAMLREPRVTSPPVTLIVQKINPCVMELCRFFQLCLCVGQRRYSRKEAMRYCVEYYSWFVKNASYVCERVKRVAYSHTLKQKCLKNICTSV